MVDNCVAPAKDRRKVFWSTQLCQVDTDECGHICYIPGIELFCPIDNACLPSDPKSISNENWLRGLAFNILYTRGIDPGTQCIPFRGSKGGHWSDSFRAGPPSGSTYIYPKSHSTVSDVVLDLKLRLQMDLGKLVQYGVAYSVEVDVVYVGSNNFDVKAVITTTDESKVSIGLIANRVGDIIAF